MSINYTEITLRRRTGKDAPEEPIAEKLYRLRFTGPALRDVERHMGKPLGQVLGEFGLLSLEVLSTFLWGATRQTGAPGNDLDRTVDGALGLIDQHLEADGDIREIRTAINNAIVLSGYVGGTQREALRALIAKDAAEAEAERVRALETKPAPDVIEEGTRGAGPTGSGSG